MKEKGAAAAIAAALGFVHIPTKRFDPSTRRPRTFRAPFGMDK